MNALIFLALQTLKKPGEAARSILLLNLSKEAIWTALFLIIVLNAAFYTLMNLLFPLTAELAFLKLSTGSYIAVSTGLTVLFALFLSLTGRWMGGEGRFQPLLILLIWLQAIQLVLQVAVVALTLLTPLLGSLLGLGGNLLLLFVLLHFVSEAHGFASLWRAAAVVLLATVLLFFALLFIVALIGPATIGLPDHV